MTKPLNLPDFAKGIKERKAELEKKLNEHPHLRPVFAGLLEDSGALLQTLSEYREALEYLNDLHGHQVQPGVKLKIDNALQFNPMKER